MHYQGAAAPAGETDHAATGGRPGPCASTDDKRRVDEVPKWWEAPLLEGQVVGGTCHKETKPGHSPEAEGPGSERENTDHKGNRAREVPGRTTSRGPGICPIEIIEQDDNEETPQPGATEQYLPSGAEGARTPNEPVEPTPCSLAPTASNPQATEPRAPAARGESKQSHTATMREVNVGQPLAAKAKGRQARCGVGEKSVFILSWGLC